MDKGFVRLIDVMGDDAAIVQAARVSYGSGTKKVHEDRGLIRYLMRHLHTTPFEMVEFKFHVKLPIFVARQWIRHRTANVNEYSGRYSEMKDEFYLPAPDQVRAQSDSNKQGRADEAFDTPTAERIRATMLHTQQALYDEYQDLLGTNLAREIARINLPVSNYTEWYWKIDLHNLLHFLALRMDSHAQLEIRNYATTIGEKIVAPLFPLVWEAFLDYRMQAMFLTRLDREVIQRLTANAAAAKKAPPWSNDDFLAAQDPSWVALTRSRERDECRSKLELLGMVVPLQSGPECAADPSRA